MSSSLPFRGKAGASTDKKATQGEDKDALSSILTFSERSDLVVLVEAIMSDEMAKMGATFDAWKPEDSSAGTEQASTPDDPNSPAPNAIDPEMRALRNATLRWYGKWRDAVLRRLCEAANTRWEPMGGSGGNGKGGEAADEAPAKSWDELSWNDEDPSEKLKEADAPIDELLQSQCPPIATPLRDQDREKRLLLLHSMLLLLLSLKHYYAPSRQLMLRLTSSLNLSLADVDADEERTATSLVSGAKALSANQEVEQKAKKNQSLRSWKVLGASIAGAAVIGLTGGLAAPLVAAGVGTVLGGLGLGATAAAGLLGSLAGSSVLVGGLFGAYGARMTGKMVDQYAQEISDFAFIPLRGGGTEDRDYSKSEEEDVESVDADARRLRVVIGVSGWLTEDGDVDHPWRVLGSRAEAFALRWELDALKALGSGLRDMVTSAAWNFARMQVLKMTVFSTLVGAVALPMGLLKLGSLVDNPFRVAKTRADKAGEVLADALINRAQGERPVVLVGYSLGARLVYSCLRNLARRRAFGLVDSVVLLGAPAPSSEDDWRMVRSVVAGRVVNAYSENDYVLGFLYRANSVQVGVAGLQPVKVPGIDNKNVSNRVSSHFHYRYLVGRILRDLGWEDFDSGELERQQEQFRQLQEQERRIAEIIEKKDNNDEEKRHLMEEMDTSAPVEKDEDEPAPPALPPRRTTSHHSGLSLTESEKAAAVPIDTTDASTSPAAAQEAQHLPEDNKQSSQSQQHQPPDKDDDDEDEQDHEQQSTGIKMVDND